jgi:hypothetical protein
MRVILPTSQWPGFAPIMNAHLFLSIVCDAKAKQAPQWSTHLLLTYDRPNSHALSAAASGPGLSLHLPHGTQREIKRVEMQERVGDRMESARG